MDRDRSPVRFAQLLEDIIDTGSILTFSTVANLMGAQLRLDLLNTFCSARFDCCPLWTHQWTSISQMNDNYTDSVCKVTSNGALSVNSPYSSRDITFAFVVLHNLHKLPNFCRIQQFRGARASASPFTVERSCRVGECQLRGPYGSLTVQMATGWVLCHQWLVIGPSLVKTTMYRQ